LQDINILLNIFLLFFNSLFLSTTPIVNEITLRLL